MLNTIMAVWNQNPGENRQRITKVFFTFLFIGISVSLLLFTLNSSAWSLFAGTQQAQTKKEEPVRNGIVTAGNTPISDNIVARITPPARTAVQSCAPTPTVVVQQRATVTPQKVEIYYGNSGLENKSSNRRAVHPKVVHVRKGKMPSRKRPEVKGKVMVTPVPHARETVSITPPAPQSVQPIVTPVVTASVTATSVPTEGTVVSDIPGTIVSSSIPGTVVTSATQAVSTVPTNSFAQSLQRKVTMRVPVAPLARNRKKSSDHVRESIACNSSPIRKEGKVQNVKRHVGMLLGGAFLGMLLLYCFVFATTTRDIFSI